MSQFIELANKLKQIGREGSFDVDTFFSMIDSSDVNFKINGIQENNTLIPITGSTSSSYIIKNLGSINSGFGSTSGWGINDIVNYDTVEQEFKILLDASSEKQSGTIVFNEGDSKFYGFNGTEWLELGSGAVGVTGTTGATGFQGFQGFQGNQGFQGFQGFQGNIGKGISYFSGPVYNPNGPTPAPSYIILGITGGPTGTFTPPLGEIANTGDYFFGTNNNTLYYCYSGGSSPFLFAEVEGRDGSDGATGTTGSTGATGFQGFQGFQGVQGFQGFQGVQGFQGFQGVQGFQGFQGSRGSGSYFYGATAPSADAEGLTLGSKWFNTEVGGEFTYLSDPNDGFYWVMTNVFSATGPQGPVGQGTEGNQGFQGFQGNTGSEGNQGFQGFQGNTGAKGETGDGLFDTTYATGTEKSNSINYSTIGSVSGSARKIPVLLNDGSLTFDFMRTTDLVPNFALQTFRFDGNNTAKDYLIGVGTFDVSGDSVSFTYIPDDVTISSSTITLEESLSSSGFPFSMGTTTTSNLPSGAGISYPTINFPGNGIHGVTLRLTTTASDDSVDTRDFEIRFKQNNYYGVTSSSSINGEDLNSFTSYLDNNYATSFTVDANSGEFIYFAYPIRYNDDAEFQFATTQVTFDPVHDSGGSTHTNPNNYQEKYYIFKSRNPGLGPETTINVV